jgi:hypothetical protein
MRIWLVMASATLAALVAAQPTDSIYPGARVDVPSTQQARNISAGQPDLEITVYNTADPYYKVFAFFQKKGKEFKTLGSNARKLPNGWELHDAFFILDDAPTMASSKRWVKLQYPYIGQYGLTRNTSGQYDIRNVTAIVFSAKK